ncbi:hypothetical protein RvY_02740 [Ramazzottius varieornatus]|uniref:Uncharacterized protein n=1 Tax=Ramazzottius varieornatus TaxID=947166 RepID=A0A1D1UPI8_RAMVA|nr:hypothetical protein RvY_02740 [Ramazzottius varieornatus]
MAQQQCTLLAWTVGGQCRSSRTVVTYPNWVRQIKDSSRSKGGEFRPLT